MAAAFDAGHGGRPVMRRLGERDLALLRGLAHDRCNSVEVLARRHWAGVEQATECAWKRLKELERVGQVEIVHKAQPVVYLTRRGGNRPPSVAFSDVGF